MDFNKMTVAELDAIIENIKEARKNAVKAEEVKAGSEIRTYLAGLAEGTIITIIFKDEKVEATYAGLTDKRFNVEIDGVKKSIMFHKLVR